MSQAYPRILTFLRDIMRVYADLCVHTLINAKGPATRLSCGIMRPEVAAMAEASQSCVDITELQAAASRIIAEATWAEASYVVPDASASLLITAADSSFRIGARFRCLVATP